MNLPALAMIDDEFLKNVASQEAGGRSLGRLGERGKEIVASNESSGSGAKAKQRGASLPGSGYWSVHPNPKTYPELYNSDTMIYAVQLGRPVHAATNKGVLVTVFPNGNVV